MSLINDYIEKLQLDLEITVALVEGAEDMLDTKAGESTLTPETVESVTIAYNYLKSRREWLITTIAKLNEGLIGKFDVLPVFDGMQSVKDEIVNKQEQMKKFADLLRPVVIGSDGGTISKVSG